MIRINNYSLNELKFCCIAKVKGHKNYEFENKASISITAKIESIVGAKSFPNNTYDGHTLPDINKQVKYLTAKNPEFSLVDFGYLGKK